MTQAPRPILSPDAALFLPGPHFEGDPPGPKLYFFKNQQFACYDVIEERLVEGYPRDTATHWPGLREACPGKALRAALHVPAWGRTMFFMFAGEPDLVTWDLDRQTLGPRIPMGDVLPGAFREGDFTPVYAEQADGQGVIHAFRGKECLRWRVGTGWPATSEPGYPHQTADDWKEGLVLAPRTGVYLEWPNRSSAHSNRKIYFFMGDLYLRWDVPSNTRNYRLDIVAGWKDWPSFA